jgi:hypothetical protein
MRTALTALGGLYASDRAFYVGLVVAWELFGILLTVTARAGAIPALLGV